MGLGMRGQGTSMGRVKPVDDATGILDICIGKRRLSALRGVLWHTITGSVVTEVCEAEPGFEGRWGIRLTILWVCKFIHCCIEKAVSYSSIFRMRFPST